MIKSAINVKNFERYLKICKGKCVLVNYEDNICGFQVGIEKLNLIVGNDSYNLLDINNEYNSIHINKENVIHIELCSTSNQLIIKLSNNSEIVVEII